MTGTRFARVDRRAFLSGVAVCAFAGATLRSLGGRAQQRPTTTRPSGARATRPRIASRSAARARRSLSPATVDGDRRGDRALSEHRCARRLERGSRRRRAEDRLEVQGGAGFAPAPGRLRRSRPGRRHGAGVRFLRRGGGQALPGPPRARADRRRQRRDARRAQRAGRGAPAAARDQHRPLARLFGRSWRSLRHGQHSGRRGRDGGERRRLIPTTPPASARSTASRRSCRPRRPRSISTRSGRCRRR